MWQQLILAWLIYQNSEAKRGHVFFSLLVLTKSSELHEGCQFEISAMVRHSSDLVQLVSSKLQFHSQTQVLEIYNLKGS